jgi:hypothetical protein
MKKGSVLSSFGLVLLVGVSEATAAAYRVAAAAFDCTYEVVAPPARK